MVVGVSCEHLLQLWKLATSSDASLLHEIPANIGR
jgi:hypothetical protein